MDETIGMTLVIFISILVLKITLSGMKINDKIQD